MPIVTPKQSVHDLATPTHGVLGLLGELLDVAVEHGLQLRWQDDSCQVRLLAVGPAAWMDVPLRKSVVRAALARIAVLCNERKANSVSPYGASGELAVGMDSATVLGVVFVNSADEQRVEVGE